MGRKNRDTALASAIGGTVALVTAVVLLAVGSQSPDPAEAAGIFPPWWTPADVLAAAGQAGMVRDLGAVPFIVVVRDPGGQARARLRQAGALFAVAPAGSYACGT